MNVLQATQHLVQEELMMLGRQVIVCLNDLISCKQILGVSVTSSRSIQKDIHMYTCTTSCMDNVTCSVLRMPPHAPTLHCAVHIVHLCEVCTITAWLCKLCTCTMTLCVGMQQMSIANLVKVSLHQLKHDVYVLELPGTGRQHDVFDLNDICGEQGH